MGCIIALIVPDKNELIDQIDSILGIKPEVKREVKIVNLKLSQMLNLLSRGVSRTWQKKSGSKGMAVWRAEPSEIADLISLGWHRQRRQNQQT